ncbi:MAG: RIP metalloprotease RseP [Vitreoscilla sp.]|nr:RIP metalloprotease RseP [Burkholderiales bacterium]MBP6336016.1 RIP metalloprotease RseP [Vitreoscilla sp.]MBP6673684.1 RIP metalloprotease RseP [Vitreoscilla sp.]
MTFLISLLAFLVTLGVLIAVHEYGHYKVARWCGVKVLRFSIGFGRVVWRRQPKADDTEFTLSALPLGGYVRMLDSREGQVSPSERGQAFDLKPLRQRAAVVAAGPLANLGLAVLLFAMVNWVGTEEPRAQMAAPLPGSLAEQAGLRTGDWVRAVSADDQPWRDVLSLGDLHGQLAQAALLRQSVQMEVTDSQGGHRRQLRLALDKLNTTELNDAARRQVGLGGAYAEPVLDLVVVGGPADLAGLKAGDRILSVAGHVVEDAAQITEQVRAAPAGVPLPVSFDRAGNLHQVNVNPRRDVEAGLGVARIDVRFQSARELVRLGPVAGLARATGQVWDTSVMSVRLLGRMLVGQASLRNLSGPLTIADVAGQAARKGLTYYLGLLALVSVSLGVLNLLPLPMLDGGLLMYYLFEGVTGRPVSDLWLKWLQRGGALVLLMMMSIALSNDVARHLGLQ